MKITLHSVIICVLGVAAVSAASAESMDGHKMVSTQDIKWGPGPASLPHGAQSALLYGDPSKDGLFAMRLKFPKGYQIAPHSHPNHEVTTVISGALHLGLGEVADQSKARPLPAGSFMALSPGTAHFAFSDEDTVIQINTNGPWGITYVNPKDDPRKSQ